MPSSPAAEGHTNARGGYHIACFLARQIGEKALKAFLYAQGEEIVVGHSVERLCHQAEEIVELVKIKIRR